MKNPLFASSLPPPIPRGGTAAAGRRPPPLPPRPGWFRLRLWHAAVLLLLIAGGAIFAFFTAWAATFDLDKIGQMPQLAEVLDLDGNPYSRL
ncbi:MAG: hypothetical protein JO117_01445, partial [Verrucomicrobia bacterium]|nr:hypothetical protein [Verrucomicrobiota bacterium]